MLTQTEIAGRIRRHVARELIDDSLTAPAAFAIYSLADPRELRTMRYVGQTAAPRRRFVQHLNTARLWLPQERPWWIARPRLRPLYEWIRALHADEGRLPTMVIHRWACDVAAAREAEQVLIHELLAQQAPLLNVERERLGSQMPLI